MARRLRNAACAVLTGLWLVGSTTAFAQNGVADEPKAQTGAADRPSTDAASGAAQGMTELFGLGSLGGDRVRILFGPLRGELGVVNISTDAKNQIQHATLTGLIRVESDTATLECEYLKLDYGQRMEARYSVHVDLEQQGVKADCGLLVYDLVKNTITLTVDPHVVMKQDNGRDGEIANLKSMTITLKPDGGKDIAMESAATVPGELKYGGGTSTKPKSDNTPPTPEAPREITPGTVGSGKSATPTPSGTNK